LTLFPLAKTPYIPLRPSLTCVIHPSLPHAKPSHPQHNSSIPYRCAPFPLPLRNSSAQTRPNPPTTPCPIPASTTSATTILYAPLPTALPSLLSLRYPAQRRT
jgi:hypothetical protein